MAKTKSKVASALNAPALTSDTKLAQHNIRQTSISSLPLASRISKREKRETYKSKKKVKEASWKEAKLAGKTRKEFNKEMTKEIKEEIKEEVKEEVKAMRTLREQGRSRPRRELKRQTLEGGGITTAESAPASVLNESCEAMSENDDGEFFDAESGPSKLESNIESPPSAVEKFFRFIEAWG